MNWIETLDAFDRQLMVALNIDGTDWGDCFWALYSGKWAWVAAAAVILYTLVRGNRNGWRHALIVLMLTALLVALTDQISSGLIKPWVCRPRPSHTEGLQDLLYYVGDYRGGRYGFVSSHAANSLGMALWLSLLFRGRTLTCTLFGWALLNCYSRIRLGVHYPGDILCGGLIGLLVAYLLWLLYRRITQRIGCSGSETSTTVASCAPAEYEPNPSLLIATVWGTVVVLCLLATFFPEVNPFIK